MKRLALYLCGTLLVVLIFCTSGLFWLFDTPSGARFAVTWLTGGAGVQISAHAVEGRLRDRLHLTGVTVSRPKFQAQIDSLDLAWEPRQLLNGSLVVSELSLSGVRIQDDAATGSKPLQLDWPRMSRMVSRLSGRISRLQLQGLSYRKLAAPPLIVTELSSSLTLQNGLLSISGLRLVSPDGRGSGEIAAGFLTPFLNLDLALLPTQPVRGMDRLSLQARLLPGRNPQQLSGGIAFVGTSGASKRLELTAELAMAGNILNLHRLNLSRPGVRGTLTGEGSLTLTTTEPLLSLDLIAADLDLANELELPTRLSGKLKFSGSLSSYQGSFSLTNNGPGWQAAALAADYQGGRAGLKLAPLSGALLQGRLAGSLEVAWRRGMQLRGKLSGRGLNPAMVAADWSGLVNLDLAGNLDLPGQGVLKGDVRGKLLDSRLQGHDVQGEDLQGELLAAVNGKRLRIEHLLLKGKGFDLQGKGELDRRLDLVATVSDLSSLVPAAAGKLQAEGWVRWRDGLLSGGASGQGSSLAMAGVQAAALQFNGQLDEGQGPPVHLDASLSRVRYGRVQAESALLLLQGTLARHTLDAALRSSGNDAQVTLAGGYGNGVWRGEVAQFSGRDSVGPWSLAAPAPLMLSASRMQLSPLVLNGLKDERLELAANLKRQPLAGDLNGVWSGLNLARANLWLDGVVLAGGSSGKLDLHLLTGERLRLSGRADAHGTIVTDGRRVTLEQVTAVIDGDGRGLRAGVDLKLAGGSGEAQLLFNSAAPAALALPREGELKIQWSDLDLALLRPYIPANIALDGRLSGLITGKLLPGNRLDLKGNAALAKGGLIWRAEGQEFTAALETTELAFGWRTGVWQGGAGLQQLSGQAAATGVYTANGKRITLNRSTLRLDAGQQSMRAALDLALAGGGTLQGDFSSASAVGSGMPDSGDLSLEWDNIDSLLLKPWLPRDFNLEGQLTGKASGKLLKGRRLELAGETIFSRGRAKWQGGSGEVNADLRTASLAFVWREETLSGKLSLALAEYGKAEGSFLLPIPARLPVLVDRKGTLQGMLSGKVQESGFLTAFFPGLVQESHGELDLDLKLGGVWSAPQLGGSLQLARGGAYLPTAGIRVSDVQLTAALEGDRVRIDSFRAISGGGHIEGTALLWLKGWQVAGYSGSVSGEKFQTVFLPELQLSCSPQLSFQGGPDSVTLSGDLLIPEMLIADSQTPTIVRPSSDVIMEEAEAPLAGRNNPLIVNGQIHLRLGDKVRVKSAGIDAQLGGSMDLVLQGIDSISSRGEIHVVKGRYRTYGIDLDIVRGRLYYVDGQVKDPNLDILALRTVGDVRAGVTVAGLLSAPVVKLYSEPAMAEVDIMAYMVLGHPLGSSSEQGSMVAMAASSLLSFGQADSLQEQIKERLGLNVFGVETVNSSGNGLMGYKEIPGTPSGMAPAKPAGTESVLTVGKYLTPKLYLSYGRSLVTGGNLFLLRYDILKQWQIETQSGSESGVDLYYKLEFK